MTTLVSQVEGVARPSFAPTVVVDTHLDVDDYAGIGGNGVGPTGESVRPM
jgi:hypothetical protein